MKDKWTDDTREVTLCGFIGQYCERCIHHEVDTDEEPCKSCVLKPTQFQKKDN